MKVNFIIKGRLGNAIFRYLASSLLCIYFNGEYVINEIQSNNCSDEDFCLLFNNSIKNTNINSLNMIGFYQYDTIYRKNKNLIIDFIKNHPSHYVLTDGINAGDGNLEKFFIKDILYTPVSFTKKYKNVLHIRLGDYISHNWFVPFERIINLLEKNIIEGELCIVNDLLKTDFEKKYLLIITEYLKNKNINVIIESNNILTDYYIMKEAEILICSRSTISWCAAFFSDKIKYCYFPDYDTESCSMKYKNPTDNTILY